MKIVQYEYIYMNLLDLDDDEEGKGWEVVEKLGEEGWESVCSFSTDHDKNPTNILFKRPKSIISKFSIK